MPSNTSASTVERRCCCARRWAAGGDSSTWAGPLASAQNRATSEIVALAARRNGFEQMLPQMRRVPFNVAVAAETTSVEASWVGAGKPKPISAGALATIDALEPLKLADVVVVTDELARLASAEQALARAISRALAQMQDETLFGGRGRGCKRFAGGRVQRRADQATTLTAPAFWNAHHRFPISSPLMSSIRCALLWLVNDRDRSNVMA